MANKKTRPLSTFEVEKFLETAKNGLRNNNKIILKPNNRLYLILLLQFHTGLRISDVLQLKFDQFEGTQLRTEESKTGKTKYVDIPNFVFKEIRDYVKKCKLGFEDFIFIDNSRIDLELKAKVKEYAKKVKKGSEKIDEYEKLKEVYNSQIRNATRAIQKQTKKISDTLKDLEIIENRGVICTHSLRKASAKNIYEQSGNNLLAVQNFLNHASVDTTIRYLDTAQEIISNITKNSTVGMSLSSQNIESEE